MEHEAPSIPDCVPVFPLPQVVLFPRAVLPLHIFEERYREMTRDALGGDGFIAIALLKPGFEPHYYTPRAPIHEIVGVGKLIASEKLADGRFNVLLQGVARARILSEVPGRTYRVARICSVACDEALCSGSQEELRKRLTRTVQEAESSGGEMVEHWRQLCDADIPVGDVADLIASSACVDAAIKQFMLAEPRVGRRVAMLVEQLETLTALARQRRRMALHGHEPSN